MDPVAAEMLSRGIDCERHHFVDYFRTCLASYDDQRAVDYIRTCLTSYDQRMTEMCAAGELVQFIPDRAELN